MLQLYSERLKNEAGEPEVFQYSEFPQRFRNQFFYILEDFNRYWQKRLTGNIFDIIYHRYLRETGLKSLAPSNLRQPRNSIEYYVNTSTEADFLDLLDYTVQVLSDIRSKPFADKGYVEEGIDSTFMLINHRLRQSSLGYEILNGKIVRKDRAWIHQEAVKPALHLLSELEFKGAEKEFLDAYEHRKNGENKDAILDALKAFESTMKTICDALSYPYDPSKSTVKDLIAILESNAFYPSYLNTHMTSVRTSLESGLPTMRNKNAGHGQGAIVQDVSDAFADYALSLSATNIVLLAKLYKEKQKAL